MDKVCKAKLKADPLPWLLETDNPSVKYFTLTELLELPEANAEVLETKELIISQGVIPKTLEKQTFTGNWVDLKTVKKYGNDFLVECGYLPKYRGTIWQLIIFAELGVDGKDPQVRKACEYVIKRIYMEQDSEGFFTFDPTLTSTHSQAPCFMGNMVFSFTRLGYRNDKRIKKTLDWLIKYQRFDDGDWSTPREWPYKGHKDRCFGSHSCYMGCIKALKAMTTIPPEERNNQMYKFIQKGAEFFLIHHIYKKSHDLTKIIKKGYDMMAFPTMYNSDFLEILLVLTELGIHDERMNDAIELLLSKQTEQGRWVLERTPSNMLTKIETRGKESKWVTFRALKVLKKYFVV